ncbi:hypothetical protein JTE90_012659 [Oedothorax gibbosus]|uniref:Uncharacterized protein n=1 Tax=Oedothorax gibbosus TaxID=931172 RepID=A0AAV6U211_9ARAC|nr:hypothetical protein JTE90_012659 [Oedothorax gibbosus]
MKITNIWGVLGLMEDQSAPHLKIAKVYEKSTFMRNSPYKINGNMDEALKVLKVRTDSSKHKARVFEWEFASFDPENPITQVSKTPSDEFPDDPDEWNEEPEDGKEAIRISKEVPKIQKMNSKG